MATQGIVSLVKRGSVAIKCVAGCNGFNAHVVADWLRDHPESDARVVYQQCLEVSFGCKECLVVQESDCHVTECSDDLSSLYGDKFGDPQFNPRWALGSADYVVVVHV